VSNVVRFPKHKLHRCESEWCKACPGGLSLCQVCGGAEGTLPTDCPGVKMDEDTSNAVWSSRLDYVYGIGWVTPAHPQWRRYIP